MKPKRAKPKASKADRRETVRTLAAGGMCGDAIAAMLKIGRDRLRTEHALDLFEGRTAKAEAEAKAKAAAPTKAQAAQRARVERAYALDPEFAADIYGDSPDVESAIRWLARFKLRQQIEETACDPQ